MKRSTIACPRCAREISTSNILSHTRACGVVKKKVYLKKGPASPEKRQQNARAGALALNKIKKHQSELNIATLDFDLLNRREKRARLLLEQNGKCFECSIEQTWNGKPLKFELDHISGIRSDESRGNLRLICPNCHQQTPTYKSSNRVGIEKKISDEDLVSLLSNSNTIHSALLSAGMNFHGRNYKRCRRLVVQHGLNIELLV